MKNLTNGGENDDNRTYKYMEKSCARLVRHFFFSFSITDYLIIQNII